ncbi:hypothetical protein [Enterovirga aerilata]|uniref:Uncharacterized protein n=1 Tax=Enterovirga aerilata TaxID=2730920 RepID=A0A849HVZ5_9HYPH|nr:hypothetical protein [Enterovirga sp. DB1703]NNM71716.1 hypothetical protein [Enterovirga sp. DB1703]
MSGTDQGRAGPVSWARVAIIVACGAAASALGFLLPSGLALEAWFLAFVTGSGLAVGSLGVLMLGHILGEHWLDPVRSEAEAAARTVPLLALFALPLSARLPELYPWLADPDTAGLGELRRAVLLPDMIVLRAALYLTVWSALAYWITGTRHPWRASAIGLALLALTAMAAAGDWIMAREPRWQSGLFPFAFVLTQLLAALAGGIFLSLLRGESPASHRMVSLERALVTLMLLAIWTWFAQFLVVWLANLPGEAAWYLRRAGSWLLPLGAAAAALGLALVLLIPAGVGRWRMLAGSALSLVAYGLKMLWLLRPAALEPALTLWDLLVPPGLAILWGLWFAAAHRRRPTFHSERHGEEAPASG